MKKILQLLICTGQKMAQWYRNYRTGKSKTLWEGSVWMIAIFYAVG